jgi:hypothetical protein
VLSELVYRVWIMVYSVCWLIGAAVAATVVAAVAIAAGAMGAWAVAYEMPDLHGRCMDVLQGKMGSHVFGSGCTVCLLVCAVHYGGLFHADFL